MKTIGYAAAGRERRGRKVASLAEQAARIQTWATANGADSVSVFREDAQAAGRPDRPNLGAAVAALAPGDVLAVDSLPCLARSTGDMIALAEHLAAREADLVSLAEGIDTRTSGGMVWRLLTAIRESATLAE